MTIAATGYHVACDHCEEVGPSIYADHGVIDRWLDGHEQHRLVLTARPTATRPVPGWAHRAVYGPPEPGQPRPEVTCPNCGNPTTTWLANRPEGRRATYADLFLHCGDCGNVWGPAINRADAISILTRTHHPRPRPDRAQPDTTAPG